MGSYRLNRRLGFFLDLYEMPGSAPLRDHLGDEHGTPLSPSAPTEGLSINKTWRVFEDPRIISTAISSR
jgi:hypothetical protein